MKDSGSDYHTHDPVKSKKILVSNIASLPEWVNNAYLVW